MVDEDNRPRGIAAVVAAAVKWLRLGGFERLVD